MYIPNHFQIADQQEAISFMQRYSFATIVTVTDGIPVATHLPFLVKQNGDQIVLLSHFSKANPQVASVINGKVLVIFTEPHAYISPKHYEKDTNVPTWNYLAVHAYGNAALLDDAESKADLLQQMINYYEADYLKRWNSLPVDYKQKMMNGIVAFEIVVDDLQAKKKLSQNRTGNERENIINTLNHSEKTNEQDIAGYMNELQ